MRVLIVDDDVVMRRLLVVHTETTATAVHQAASLAEAQVALSGPDPFDVVLLDLWLEADNALLALPSLTARWPEVAFVVLTAHGSFDIAVEAMRAGAAGFLTKPVDPARLHSELAKLAPNLRRPKNSSDAQLQEILEAAGIIGRSQPMLHLAELLLRAKDVDSTVLITGESGSGKELVARALHRLSKRGAGAFEPLNCGALPSGLVESELFGHARGAFTDAKVDRPGLFARCDGGTVFLDEIGELPLQAQAALLRVLQDKEVRPIGAAKGSRVEVRTLAATNRNLAALVRSGAFRADLFYRLTVIEILVPSLRQRPEDIPGLALAFAMQFRAAFNRDLKLPRPEKWRLLMDYEWPGNVRELRNRVESAVAMCSGTELKVEAILPSNSPEERCGTVAAPLIAPFEQERVQFEREYLTRLLGSTHGNVAEAARVAGKFRSDLYRLIGKHGIDPDQFR